MPQVTAEIFVPLEPAVAFAVSQTTGPIRLRWDPFLRHQYFLDGATAADQGVHTYSRARLGPRMISR